MSGLREQGVLIVAGPTASGKTELAIDLAHEFDAEIVGADSRQIYRGMPIGTAVPSAEQLSAVPHHLIGFLDPRERYSAARFASDAVCAIAAIAARGKRAIVVGGTGFYVRALTGGIDLAPQYDQLLRDRLAREARLHDDAFLHEWLAVRDARRAAMVHPGDRYRVLRALEVALCVPNAARCDVAYQSLKTAGVAFATVVLKIGDDELDARIARRTDAMLESGLVEEAQRIGADAVASNAVGYPQALAYLAGWCTRRELRASLVRATRRYAKRQQAWFRSEPRAHWLAPPDVARAARELLGWA
ncbi:MAG TPA: tRNA (adenosine(37)-N6)-dimethylallyltransferase MiaA [Candidatus Baltobacteraceae bacterium]